MIICCHGWIRLRHGVNQVLLRKAIQSAKFLNSGFEREFSGHIRFLCRMTWIALGSMVSLTDSIKKKRLKAGKLSNEGKQGRFMNEETKRSILNEMYRIHEAYLSGLDLACKIRCADCCTRNVTMTTVEGLNIVENLDEAQRTDLQQRLEKSAGQDRFRPAITVNGMADLCSEGKELPDEQLDPGAGSCPLLIDGACSIYPYRPFECRAFVSQKVCRENGHADMSSLTVNVNNLFRQYIEHIDVNGMSGNLTDVLLQLLERSDADLIANRAISVLMIDPDHQDPLNEIMEKLNTIRV